MTLRKSLASLVLLAAFAGPAVAQGVKVAGEPAVEAAAAPKEDAPKKTAKPKKKAAKGKKKRVAESKYKSTTLSENSETHYRYDEKGNPIDPAAKKKAKGAKKSSAEDADEKAACSDDAPCADKKTTEADSL